LEEKAQVRVAVACEEDVAAWLDLAAEVESLFGPMVSDPLFHQALYRNIGRGSAFCIRSCVREGDGLPGVPLLGGLLFSSHPPKYRIGWLAVREESRRCGVGRRLVEHVLSLVQPPAEVSVITFVATEPEGMAARSFYENLGFSPAELMFFGPARYPRQVFRLSIG